MADPNAPQHSEGYGPAEQADDTRQAQQTVSNDAPTDVNINAVIARTQAGTFALMGAEFEAAAARRTILADTRIPQAAG
jgi:hypothetical protein